MGGISMRGIFMGNFYGRVCMKGGFFMRGDFSMKRNFFIGEDFSM